MKECHSKQGGDYDCRLKDTREASRLITKSDVPSAFPSVLGVKNGLHEMNDFACASEGKAQKWTFSDDNTCEDDKDKDCTASSGCHDHNRVNGGERERSKLAIEDSHHSCLPMVPTGGMDCPSGTNVASDANHARASHSVTSEWVSTVVRNDDGRHEIGCTDRQCNAREKNDVSLAITSPLGLKDMVKEVGQRGGKRELSYADGSKTIMFPNGSKKDIDASGHVVIEFANGDRQEVQRLLLFCCRYWYLFMTESFVMNVAAIVLPGHWSQRILLLRGSDDADNVPRQSQSVRICKSAD